MWRIAGKLVEKAIKLKEVNPADPITQDTVAWVMDVAKSIIKGLF